VSRTPGSPLARVGNEHYSGFSTQIDSHPLHEPGDNNKDKAERFRATNFVEVFLVFFGWFIGLWFLIFVAFSDNNDQLK